MFCELSEKSIKDFIENIMSLNKAVVWKTHKWHENFNCPSGLWVFDHNEQNIVLINNSRTLDLLSCNAIFKFALESWYYFHNSVYSYEIYSAQNLFNFGSECSSPLT